MSKNVHCEKMICNQTLLVVLFVVLLSCFLNNLITFQTANSSLFSTSPDGSLTILTVTTLANVPSSDTALQPHLKRVNYIQRRWIYFCRMHLILLHQNSNA